MDAYCPRQWVSEEHRIYYLIPRSPVLGRSFVQTNLKSARCKPLSNGDHHLSKKQYCQGKSLNNGSTKQEAEQRDTKTVSGSKNALKQGTLLGAIALITGTSVGAGILALPARTIAPGFIPSALVMGSCWLFLVMEALLMVEINLSLMNARRIAQNSSSLSKVVSLRTMAESTLGSWGGTFVGITYLLLTNALIVAYIAKAGEVLSLLLHLPRHVAQVLFTLAFGGFIYLGGNKLADQTNQVLTGGLIGLFILLVVGGSAYSDWQALLHVDWTMAPKTIPVIFLALVYHDLIPVICAYLNGNSRSIRTAIIVGSGIPFAMLLCWDAVAISIAPVAGNVDPIDFLMRNGGPGTIVEIFSLLAVFTSIIGSTLALSEFFIEQLSSLDNENTNVLENASKRESLSLISLILVLVPPLLISVNVPDAFFTAADLAGGYGMGTLYGILPPVMAWGLPRKNNSRSWMLRLGATGVCAVGIIINQLLLDFSPS